MSSLGYLMYLRISTEKQEEGYGLDKQERDCTTYAERNSFPVIAPPITDTITGDSSSREGLDKVLSILRAGKAKGVIIPSADRLARKTWIGIQALEQIHKANREVHFTSLGMIPNSPQGRFNAQIHLSVAELDKATLLDKLHGARREKIAKRKQTLNSGHAPYGYRFVGTKKHSSYEVVPEEAETIKLIFKLHRETRSVTTVRDYLSLHKIPTYEDLHPRPAAEGKKPSKQRNYGDWEGASIYKILKHPVYKGKAAFYRAYLTTNEDGETVKRIRKLDDPAILWVDVPAIVSEQEWAESQMIITSNESRNPHNRQVDYLLSGRLKCKQCGLSCSGKYFKGNDKSGSGKVKASMYYVCTSTNKGGRTVRPCNMRMFRREHVEDAVWTYVEEQLLDPDCLEEGIRNMGKHTEHEQDRLRTQLNDLRRQLENTKLQQDRLVSLFLSGIYSEEELSVHKKQLDHSRTSIEAGIAETEHQLAGLAATEEEILVLRDFAGQIIQGLDRTKMEHKKKLLKILGVRVEMAIEESQKILFVRSHLSPEAVARVLVISPNLHPS